MKLNFFSRIALLSFCQLSACLAVFGESFDTTIDRRAISHELGIRYLQKSKTQKTVGWVMIGAGSVAMIGAGLSVKHELGSSQITQNWSRIGAVGFLSTISGMAFLKSSSLNKTRARILLRTENISPGAPNVSKKMTVLGIGIRI